MNAPRATRTLLRCWILAMVLIAGMARGLAAQDDGMDSLRIRQRQLFERLKAAVAQSDSIAVARLVVYPLRVNRTIRDHSDVRSEARLLRRYRAVFTDSVQRAILAQDPDSLFYSWRGTMVGHGEVWIRGDCETRGQPRCQTGIVAVNLPSRPVSRER